VNIELIAFDFDLTMIDVHTGGHWNGDAQELALHIRPETRCLVVEALERGLHVAIASFSRQDGLISQVLDEGIAEASNYKIFVSGGNNKSEETGKQVRASFLRFVSTFFFRIPEHRPDLL
jgi:hypothetical protein